MPHSPRGRNRRRAVDAVKRQLILDAAARVFAADGLEGASMRAIAAEAGYTAAALYFHFDSKEAIYADLLADSLDRLREHIESRTTSTRSGPRERIIAAARSFYGFYSDNPQDLSLGFYLFRGGLRPKGVGSERNKALNDALFAALDPIRGAAIEHGMTEPKARALTAEIFAHLSGLLLLNLTGRIRVFRVEPDELFEAFMARVTAGFES